MPAVGILGYTSPVMNAAIEYRHNDEPLGRVYDSGAVEVHEDVPHAAARFWMGRRARRAGVCQVLPFKRSVLPAASSTPKD